MGINPIISYSDTGQPHRGMPELAVPVGQHDHVIGNAEAPVTLVQYGDYECAGCLDAEPIVKELLRRHGRRLRFAFRHFPMNAARPQESLAALAAEAAAVQGKFWEMHDLLLRNRGVRSEAEVTHLALAVGLEVYRFNAELGNAEHEDRVRADFIGGIQSGVRQTPTFFVNGVRVSAHRGFELLYSATAQAVQYHAKPYFC